LGFDELAPGFAQGGEARRDKSLDVSAINQAI
jgi:hypothetical protein